ncbi:MAG: cytochrome c [Acidobacteriia bacterium]|nr:cytochrome c [Terriglobia bacterium]
MNCHLKSRLQAAAILIGLLSPLMMLDAQEGARGGGGVSPKNVPAPTSPVTGNPTAGKQLYYSFGCYACHGYNGETGARAFVGRWGNLATEQSFITFLRGRANIAPIPPSTSMPNFSESSMSDKQAKDIYAYIRTFKSTAPDLKDASALNAILEAARQEKK